MKTSKPNFLTVPPVFGDTVRFLESPMMVVVDANPPPSGSDRTSCVAVCYLDDCAILHSERVPWGLLETCSVKLLEAERAERCEALGAELSARETTRTNARLKVMHDAVASSSDPASLFGSLRNAFLEVLRGGFEVDHRGSPEDVAAREATDLGACPEVLRSGTYETDHKAVSSADDPAVLERYRRADAAMGGTLDLSDPLAGRGGEPMACLSSSEVSGEVSGTTETLQSIPTVTSAIQRPFTPHTHF